MLASLVPVGGGCSISDMYFFTPTTAQTTVFLRMQATAANLDRLVDQVWASDADAATLPLYGAVSLARLGVFIVHT